MRVATKFFGGVSEVNHRKQGLRLLACVAQIATDPVTAEETLHQRVVHEPSGTGCGMHASGAFLRGVKDAGRLGALLGA
eukprot:12184930-Alexandrium_andersonii.AAC.1